MANPIPTATSFKPGQSGNPEGLKKKTAVRDCFLRLNAQSDGNLVREVCEKVVELAKEGEQWAVQELFNRIDGIPSFNENLPACFHCLPAGFVCMACDDQGCNSL